MFSRYSNALLKFSRFHCTATEATVKFITTMQTKQSGRKCVCYGIFAVFSSINKLTDYKILCDHDVFIKYDLPTKRAAKCWRLSRHFLFVRYSSCPGLLPVSVTEYNILKRGKNGDYGITLTKTQKEIDFINFLYWGIFFCFKQCTGACTGYYWLVLIGWYIYCKSLDYVSVCH